MRVTTRRWIGGVVVRAGKGFVTRLPVEAADALVMDTVFLVMSCMVAGGAEWFFRCGVAEGEMVEFLEERESIRACSDTVLSWSFSLRNDQNIPLWHQWPEVWRAELKTLISHGR